MKFFFNVIQQIVKKTISNRFKIFLLFLHDFNTTKKNLLLQIFKFQFENFFEIFFNKRFELRFKLKNELFYYINFDDKKKRLCILNVFKKKKFELIYNRQYYGNFYRTYNRIANFIYFKYLSKHLRIYINHYSKCEFN